jgi:hypothetical protein
MRNQLSRRLHQFVAPATAGAQIVGDSMSTSPDPLSINQIDAAYIAGIVDGEGTITLTRKHRNEHRQLAVTISSTERCLLEFVRATCGVGKITNKRVSKSNHAPSFTFSVYNRQALILLEHISPYLRTYKRHRAELILANYLDLTPRNGKYTPLQLERKSAFEAEVLSIRANSFES